MKPLEISHKPYAEREDGGGALVVTANTAEAKVRVLRHFNQEQRIVEALRDDAPLAIAEAGGTNARAYFRCQASVAEAFTAPYYALLEKMTGRDMTQESIPEEWLTAFYPGDGLQHTHYAIGVGVHKGALAYDFVVAAQDWNSLPAHENAKRYAAECAQECLGMRYQEPEFLSCSFGDAYRKNPNWTKRHPVTPAVTYNNWFMKAICCTWVERHATPGQVAALELNKGVMAQARCVGELWAAKNLRRDWETPEITWEEFQTL
jgi:hypothetical protein